MKYSKEEEAQALAKRNQASSDIAMPSNDFIRVVLHFTHECVSSLSSTSWKERAISISSLAPFSFLIFRMNSGAVKDPNRPKFLFAYPYMDGTKNYAEHVRLPDYLAGLCADINLPNMEFSHTKFERIFGEAIINSKNNVLLQVLGNPEKITVRRLTFRDDQ
jgi:hypothetical protein